jgi:glycosyltransferase involved in cell wall biosynthesis
MRIMLVTFDPPERVGGIEGRSRRYALELKSRGHFVDLVSLSSRNVGPPQTCVPLSLYKFDSSMSSILISFLSCIRVMKRDMIDRLILLSGSVTLLGIFLLIYSKISKFRSLIFFYGRDILQARRSVLGRLVLATSVRLADRIATNSYYTAELIPGESFKSYVIYPSVDPSIADSINGISVNHRGKRILFVGRLVRRKGVDVLLRAFKQLSADLGDDMVKLSVIGDGPELSSLKSLRSELSLDGNVTFYGAMQGKPLYSQFASSDLLVLPSRRLEGDVEGFGTVILEAALFAKPSVGTTSGGIREAIVDNETGLLVEENSVGALKKALHRLLSDDEFRRRLGENARARVLTRFRLSNTVDILERILLE